MIYKNSHNPVKLYKHICVLMMCFLVFQLNAGCSFKKSVIPSDETETTVFESSGLDASDTSNPNENIQQETSAINQEPNDENASDDSSSEEGIIWYDDSTWVYVNNSWLNIRGGPSTDNEILTEVYYGQALKRTAVSDYWSRIILPDGREGYAYNSYLSLEPLEDQESQD